VVSGRYADGWYDDGSESGALRTRPIRSDLAPVPFKPGEYATELSGATVTNNVAVAENPDGSTRSLGISVAAASINNGFRLWQVLYGTVIGVRWKRVAGACDFTLVIDGVPYVVTGVENVLVNEGITVTDAHGAFVVENLPDGKHIVELVIPADSVAVRAIELYGWLLERRWGYDQIPRAQTVTRNQLTTSQVAVPTSANGTPQSLRGIRKIVYTNISAGAAKVIVQLSANTIWAKSIAAGDSAELDFGAPTVLAASFNHASDTATAINFLVVGEGY
jgi:hypothetical protein